jgi:hypothetical protein
VNSFLRILLDQEKKNLLPELVFLICVLSVLLFQERFFTVKNKDVNERFLLIKSFHILSDELFFHNLTASKGTKSFFAEPRVFNIYMRVLSVPLFQERFFTVKNKDGNESFLLIKSFHFISEFFCQYFTGSRRNKILFC